MSINAMEGVNENERFVVKNGIKWIYIYVTMIGQVMREYVYLWYRLLEINVGTRDTAADEMLTKKWR
jgi:hypothetical protein